MIEKISVCDGKYEIVYDNKSGALSALRYGESWRNLSGDKMVFALFCEIQDLRAKLAEALKPSHNTASDACAALNTAEAGRTVRAKRPVQQEKAKMPRLKYGWEL